MRYTKHGGLMPESEVLSWIKGVLDRMKTPGEWIIPRSRLQISKREDGTIRLEDMTPEEYRSVVEAADKHEEETGGSVIKDAESLDSAMDTWCNEHFVGQRAQDIVDMMHFIPLAGYEIEVSLSDETYAQLEATEEETDENE